jgi:hypothetical protein
VDIDWSINFIEHCSNHQIVLYFLPSHAPCPPVPDASVAPPQLWDLWGLNEHLYVSTCIYICTYKEPLKNNMYTHIYIDIYIYVMSIPTKHRFSATCFVGKANEDLNRGYQETWGIVETTCGLYTIGDWSWFKQEHIGFQHQVSGGHLSLDSGLETLVAEV